MEKELKKLQRMTVGELQQKYLETFGEKTRSNSKDFLWKRVAWRLQANAWGGIPEREEARALDLANDADLRVRAPQGMFDPPALPAAPSPARKPTNGRPLLPDTVLSRMYRGETVQVTVRENGFEYDGKIFKSLTAVAKAITGSHWNGHHFFGLKKKGE